VIFVKLGLSFVKRCSFDFVSEPVRLRRTVWLISVDCDMMDIVYTLTCDAFNIGFVDMSDDMVGETNDSSRQQTRSTKRAASGSGGGEQKRTRIDVTIDGDGERRVASTLEPTSLASPHRDTSSRAVIDEQAAFVKNVAELNKVKEELKAKEAELKEAKIELGAKEAKLEAKEAKLETKEAELKALLVRKNDGESVDDALLEIARTAYSDARTDVETAKADVETAKASVARALPIADEARAAVKQAQAALKRAPPVEDLSQKSPKQFLQYIERQLKIKRAQASACEADDELRSLDEAQRGTFVGHAGRMVPRKELYTDREDVLRNAVRYIVDPVVKNASAGAACVVASPGLGKSSLLDELCRQQITHEDVKGVLWLVISYNNMTTDTEGHTMAENLVWRLLASYFYGYPAKKSDSDTQQTRCVAVAKHLLAGFGSLRELLLALLTAFEAQFAQHHDHSHTALLVDETEAGSCDDNNPHTLYHALKTLPQRTRLLGVCCLLSVTVAID
jgi:hypothetical protein